VRRVRLRAGEWEAVFLPEVGMLGASLQHRGTELLSLHGGVAAYRAGHTPSAPAPAKPAPPLLGGSVEPTPLISAPAPAKPAPPLLGGSVEPTPPGMPLLAPWANRLSRKQFRVAGVDVDHRRLPLHRDRNGLANHGTMAAVPGWEVLREEPARLVARFAYEADRAFPFPHELTVDALLAEDGLTVKTSLRPTGRRRVPVSFGWHPYFRLPGRRRDSTLGLPACSRLELDARGIPTGKAAPFQPERSSAPARPERLALGDRELDDLFALGSRRRFTLEGGGRKVEIRFGRGYDFAQIYGPRGKRFVAIEPMTAPTDALVTGACRVVRPGESFSATFEIAAA
jgi:aldose 1-epimerase